jgi:hypothetical protein
MHLGQPILQCVVFLGYEDPASASGFKCVGTGFLLVHHGQGYLVTVRHVAENLGSDPFTVRMNHARDRRAVLLAADNIKWTMHPDPLVDLAATRAVLTPDKGFETQPVGWVERLRNPSL